MESPSATMEEGASDPRKSPDVSAAEKEGERQHGTEEAASNSPARSAGSASPVADYVSLRNV